MTSKDIAAAVVVGVRSQLQDLLSIEPYQPQDLVNQAIWERDDAAVLELVFPDGSEFQIQIVRNQLKEAVNRMTPEQLAAYEQAGGTEQHQG